MSNFLSEQARVLGELRACNSLLSSSSSSISNAAKLQALQASHETDLRGTTLHYESQMSALKSDLTATQIDPLREELAAATTSLAARDAAIEQMKADYKATETKFKQHVKGLKVAHEQELYVARKIG